MQIPMRAWLVMAAAPLAAAEAPVGKVLSMISDLQATVIKEGEVAQQEYAEFAEWCEDRARDLGFQIKTGKGESDALQASIAQESSTIESLSAKIDGLASDIATDEVDLKAATEIRQKEAADFAAEQSELSEIVDMLRRAGGIIEREMKGGASMLQLKNAGSLLQAFSVIVQASLISSSDGQKLSAFLQNSQNAEDEDEPGAPASAVYESHSGGILDVLQGLEDKADSQLSDLRNQETADVQNFEMLKQSLKDELRFANNDMDAAKKNSAASAERKSTAEGDLEVTSKDLAEDGKAKRNLHHDCMTKASTFEAETNSRGEELKALATAKKVIEEATVSALNQMSLLQTARSQVTSRQDLAKFEIVRLVRDLARKDGSPALMQLSTQLASALHTSDPFDKIRGLIADMIDKLEQEAGADASKKAYCDKELSETNEKKTDKTAEIKKLSTSIGRMTARSAELKEEIAALQNELSKLANSQATMDKMRQEEKSTFDTSKAELDKALTGVKLALKILNEYYATEGKAHEAAEGAGRGIIGLLEVVEADFSKELAQVTSDEELAVAEYEQVSNDNEIEKVAKTQDVKYKTKESKQLDKTSGELSSDRSGVQAELDAVLEYLAKIEEECIAKAETYATRKARYASEIAGLKDALQILESETALVQSKASRRVLRGGNLHRH